jgi:hypothetical protein
VRGSKALSKSRFVDGYRCPKLLWLRVHEPSAPELAVDAALQDRFDQGTAVGEVARERFPGGELIDLPHYPLRPRVDATQAALSRNPPAIYEASFLSENVFCAVDVLNRRPDGYGLVEVKSSTSLKDVHVVDAAIQTLAVRGSGLPVATVEVMHLNREYRHPGQGDLFIRQDVTSEVESLLPSLPSRVSWLLGVLAGPEPQVEIGPHCYQEMECPFLGRCWPSGPGSIRRLSGVGAATALEYIQRGIEAIGDIPEGESLSAIARRQIQAELDGRPCVDPGLRRALETITGTVGFLDFETVSRALPVWPGTGPWQAIPAQFSYHESLGAGVFSHAEWLAQGPDDPRPAIAETLVAVCRSADVILTYTGFEKRCIRSLAEGVPALAPDLEELEGRMVDLHPIVRSHVYHPEFRGSFSIKKVLPALVPGLSYDDLEIDDGMVASARIGRMMLCRDDLSDAEYDAERRHLLEYCKRDTWAMVKLLEALWALAG